MPPANAVVAHGNSPVRRSVENSMLPAPPVDEPLTRHDAYAVVVDL